MKEVQLVKRSRVLLQSALATSMSAVVNAGLAQQVTVLPEVEVLAVESEPNLYDTKSQNRDIVRTEDDAQARIVIDRAAIERSSATTVEALLAQQLSMSTSTTATVDNDWTAGATKINLRGLGEDETLVLINGRRIAGSGGRSGTEFSAQPNLRNIPLGLIDRIEILPASSSAIYGGGAVGGVINVVMRKDYSGGEISFDYDAASDGRFSDKSVNFIKGISLQDGRTQVLLSGRRQLNDALRSKDRQFARDGRARLIANNPNSLFGTPGRLTAPPGAAVNVTSISGAPLFAGHDTSRMTIPEGFTGFRDHADPANADFNAAQLAILEQHVANGGGEFNLDEGVGVMNEFSGEQTIMPKASAEFIDLHVTHALTPNLDIYVQAAYDENRSESLRSYYGTRNVTLRANNPLNPFGQDVSVHYPLDPSKVPSLVSTSVTTSKRASMGLSYNAANEWNILADYGWSTNYSKSTYLRQLGTPSLTQAFDRGLEQALIDTVAYPVNIDAYGKMHNNHAYSAMHDFTLRGSGPLATLPAGKLNLATGIGHQRVKSVARFDAAADSTAPFNRRELKASNVYAELNVPLISPQQHRALHLLDVQLAGRYEHFDVKTPTNSSSFSAFMPTIGLRLAPSSQILLRGSYSKGFVPPTYTQLTEPSIAANPSTIVDPLTGESYPVSVLSGGNPNITPEKSESYNFGVVFTPDFASGLRASIDYFDIRKDNNITTPGAQYVLDNAERFPDRVIRDETGRITQVNTYSFNSLWLRTRGLDTRVNYLIPTRRLGTFDLGLGYTLTQRFRSQPNLTGPVSDTLNVPSSNESPLRHRANASLTWEINPVWTVAWNTQYYGSYKLANATQVLNQGAPKVGSMFIHGAFVRANLGRFSLGDVQADSTLTVGVRNIFNTWRTDMSRVNNNYYSSFNDAALRRYFVNLNVKF